MRKVHPYAIGETELTPNAQKLKKVQSELNNTYLKEQTEYIQDQINKIRDSVDDRQSRIAWQTVKEVSRKKSTVTTKLKTASQEEWIHQWKLNYMNLLGKSPHKRFGCYPKHQNGMSLLFIEHNEARNMKYTHYSLRLITIPWHGVHICLYYYLRNLYQRLILLQCYRRLQCKFKS